MMRQVQFNPVARKGETRRELPTLHQRQQQPYLHLLWHL